MLGQQKIDAQGNRLADLIEIALFRGSKVVRKWSTCCNTGSRTGRSLRTDL